MALIHRATLSPSKIELLRAWLPGRPWGAGAGDVEQVAAYRFDDPDGEVGLESFLLRAGDGRLLHVPLSYRGAPLDGAEAFLVGTTEHSVLGTRWVYDACADPVYVAALATAVLAGGTQVEELVDEGGRLVPRDPSATVQGSGSSLDPVTGVAEVRSQDAGPVTVVEADGLRVEVVRIVGAEVTAAETLVGRWPDGGPEVLAGVTSRTGGW
jgi:hypothetical protein